MRMSNVISHVRALTLTSLRPLISPTQNNVLLFFLKSDLNQKGVGQN